MASSSGAITVEGLGKRYQIGLQPERYSTLRSRIQNVLTAPARRVANVLRGSAAGTERHQTFWALRDVGFEVRQGDVVGIIGRNGAGKSTLLKILTRITEPTTGFADIEGRVGSLLEVGTGFHPELTGRENVFLNGAILGMGRAEIERKFDEIVEFAEIEKFIDTPVKHYSSGMYVRLAFGVAAHLEPEVLMVDEVLSVGDAAFQQRCLGKMGNVARSGRTILFVSHNMAAITRLCTDAIWLESGQIRMRGSPNDVVAAYLAAGSELSGSRVWEGGYANPGVSEFRIESVRVMDEAGQETNQLDARRAWTIEIRYRVLERLPVCRIGFLLYTLDGTTVFDAYDSDDDRHAILRAPGEYTSRCTVPGKLLSPGRYMVSINAGIPRVRNLAFAEGALAVDVVDTGAVGSHMSGGRSGVIRPELQWQVASLSEEVLLPEASVG